MKTLDYLNLNEARVANVVTALQNLLADFQIYYTNLRGFHWEIKGRGFFVLHEKFESMYDDAAAKVDEIAERILMLGGTPENKFSNYLKTARIHEVSGVSTSHEAVENILSTYKHFIAEERKLIELEILQLLLIRQRAEKKQICSLLKPVTFFVYKTAC